MEGLLILAVLAVVLYAAQWFLTRRVRRRLERALIAVEQRLNVAHARLRAAEEHAATVRTRTLGWDQPTRDTVRLGSSDLPPREFIVPTPDRVAHHFEAATEVLEPLRSAEQIMADFPPPPEIPSWRRSAEPVQVSELAEPEEAPESSPLYEYIAATVPVTEPDAELLVPPYVEPAVPALEDAFDVEPIPADEADVPQDEARVTGLHRSGDDEEPPSGPLDDDRSDGPRVDETAPLAVAAYRHDWSASRPVGPLHGARPHSRLAHDSRQWMAAQTRQAWARIWAVPQLQVQRPSWWRRMWRDLTAWWTENVATEAEGVAAETSQGWGPEDLGDGHLIVRHRRRRGTWAVA